MIDIKPPVEEKPANLFYQHLEEASGDPIVDPINYSVMDSDIKKELHEINNTLKDILREMRKGK